jgi:outer membrane biosynthesis protein TonB
MGRAEKQSLRFSRFESKRLLFALLLSILLHLGGWGGYEAGKKLGWWNHLHALTLLGKKLNNAIVPPAVKKEQEQQQPTVFVEVDQADPEPPKKAVYYSDKNTQAANPDAVKNSNQPKLDGKQKDIPKTETVPKLTKLVPAPPKTPSPESPPAKTESSSLALGDQKLAKVETNQPAENPTEKSTPEKKRPRTLSEARQQQHLPGEQMQQDGGVLRTKLVASFDTKATAFGAYDAAIFAAIQQYWDDELENNSFARDRTGRVTVQFVLHYDGTVSQVQIVENGVGILLGSYCQESIDRTAPYAKWPSDMLHEIGSTERPITVTFIYY